jgi:uncharacterized membrane protein
VALHNVYFLTLLRTYRDGDLSQVYPIARGTAPPLVALLAATLAGEDLRHGQWLGVALVSLGVLSLALDRRLLRDGQVKSVLYALMTAGLIALYTVVDAIGLRHAESVFGYIYWLIALSGVPFVAVVATLRAGRLRALPARAWARGGVAGLLAVVSYSALLWALSLGAIAAVAALRETSVIFAVVIGAIVLNEPFGGRRITAAAVVGAGAVALNLPV